MSDTAPETAVDRIPVSLLTGFLGAGKTTLLNRLTRHPDMAGTALLINEVGEVGIDHHLVETVNDNMMILDSGCLCCSVTRTGCSSCSIGKKSTLSTSPRPMASIWSSTGCWSVIVRRGDRARKGWSSSP